MNVEIAIRKLTNENGGLYRGLMLRAYSEHGEAFTSTFEERASKPLEWWQRRLNDPTTVTLGAFTADDVLIGTVRLERYQRGREQHKLNLTAMYVIQEYSEMGVGRRLIDEALREARKLSGVEIVKLTVTADNLSAVRLYSKIGFQNFGCEARALRTASGTYLDKLHMWRPISADYVVQN